MSNISIVSRFRGARVVTNGCVCTIREPVTGVPLGVAVGDTAIEAHVKGLYKVTQILGTETAIAKRLAERFLV